MLVDEQGHLEHVFLVRPGPITGLSPHRRPGPRKGVRGRIIVELTAATTMLDALDPTQHPEWARLIHRVQARLAGLDATDAQIGGAHHPATTVADAHRRRAGRELDRWIRVRDRHCIGVLCTRPAHTADVDHTRDWVDHGLTVAGNLGGPCRHCHRLKHDGRWRLHQPEPGRFVWHTPHGATYTVEPRPVLEPPTAPLSTPDGRPRPVLDIDPPPDDDEPLWTDTRPPRTYLAADVPDPPGPRTPTDDEPPPF